MLSSGGHCDCKDSVEDNGRVYQPEAIQEAI